MGHGFFLEMPRVRGISQVWGDSQTLRLSSDLLEFSPPRTSGSRVYICVLEREEEEEEELSKALGFCLET